jgi:hypothetical protein
MFFIYKTGEQEDRTGPVVKGGYNFFFFLENLFLPFISFNQA